MVLHGFTFYFWNMKSKNYKYIITFITTTILATIGLQFYWNVKNYRENKKQLVNDVQIAFDNSIEYYYVEDSKDFTMAFINADSTSNEDFLDQIRLDTVFKKMNTIPKANVLVPKPKDSMKYSLSMTFTQTSGDTSKAGLSKQMDSIKKQINADDSKITFFKTQPKIGVNPKTKANKISSIKVLTGKKSADSILKIKNLTNRIVVSLFQDSIQFKKLKKALDKELTRKNISIDYAFEHIKEDTVFAQFGKAAKIDFPLSTFSKSTYLTNNQKLKILFSDPTLLILKRSMNEIVLSLLLSLSIIFCLLYLLRTINRQKKIDEIKNDLISNITHEFKTPITTVSTAIEGIKSFNSENDTEKTNRYLDISSNQLKKLELMVEKLLETASLETDKLVLQKEKINPAEIIENQIEKHKFFCPEKYFFIENDIQNPEILADVFHFENVISNLLDNAIKYGGDTITAKLKSNGNRIEITIKDNGSGLEKTHRDKIFEKFYRVPKGNRHDVKGFGIGLYYSKKIIEKHGGTLQLVSESNANIFKITLFHAK